MSRELRILVALLGLWCGAFAWTQAERPEQRHVAHLAFTAGPVLTPPALFTAWSPREPAPGDLRVARDLFAVAPPSMAERPTTRAVSTAAPSPSATPAPLVAPFRYIGFVADGAGRKVLLSGDQGVQAGSEGALLDGGWRIERIGSEEIVLLHVADGREAVVRRTP